MEFFGQLYWIDGRPLLDTIEHYRQRIFTAVLYSFKPNDQPRYSAALNGRGKKNYKSADLVLAGFYRLLVWPSPNGNDVLIIANDEGQAADDLDLAKKLVAANPVIAAEVTVAAKTITRNDGKGRMTILPARDTQGAHGKTYSMLGVDELHAYQTYDLLEALSPDPTRPDALRWFTSYASLYNTAGYPLHDFFVAGKRGDDPGLFFSWYAGDYCTDPAFADLLTPEERANPSMQSWPDAATYLAEEKKRLPSNKYRRLHLNLPGAPSGAAFSAEHIVASTITGRRSLPYDSRFRYVAFVDMSGGSNDDATLGIAHKDNDRLVLDLVAAQAGPVPFNPRHAVARFANILREYRLNVVTGDAYGGQTFRQDFQEHGIIYRVSTRNSASDLYEAFEPHLTASEVELLDVPKLQEQLLTLVWRGSKITHQSGDHDDWANSACGAVLLAAKRPGLVIGEGALAWARGPSRLSMHFSPQPQGTSQADIDRFNARQTFAPSVSASDLME